MKPSGEHGSEETREIQNRSPGFGLDSGRTMLEEEGFEDYVFEGGSIPDSGIVP